MNKRWLINRTNPEYVSYISKTASISPVIAQILINRGIKTADDINGFLNSGVAGLSDPMALPGMEAAVKRIKAALSGNERILVSGDYDADGLSATAIVVYALRLIGADVHYFIPNRMLHGYGFNTPSVEAAKNLNAALIITVDCGITSFDAAAYAKESGIDVIITDHHEPLLRQGIQLTETKDFIIPDALAVLNPKLLTHDPRPSGLSGAGIAFKLVQALAMENDLRLAADYCMPLLDLAALGTIADVVPLLGENRIIIKEGLRYIHEGGRPGIRSLKEVSGLNDREIKAGLLSFTLIPRINAAGRVEDANDVVKLFLSDSYEETLSIAVELDRKNTERQRIEAEVYREAVSQVNSKGYGAAVVLWGADWHLGVLGIVASKLAEEFNRPAFVFAIKDNIAKGSARSIPSLDIHQGLSACRELLISFGGHKQAAGIKLYASDLPAFEKMINGIVENTLKNEDFVSTLDIDAQVALSEIDAGLIDGIAALAPFGCGNPEPLLGAKKLNILNPKVVGNNHLKMRLSQKSLSMDAIGFNMGSLLEKLSTSTPVDAAFTPTINEWNNSRHLQLNLKAMRISPQET